jgi:hypothetical protein
VIDELREDAAARQRFLRACGVYGAMLAVSIEGGAAGERTFPLLIADADWDALGDGLAGVLRELEDHDLARLLAALREAVSAELEQPQEVEAQGLAQYVAGAVSRVWSKQPRVLPIFVLETWYALNAALREPVSSPPIDHTWAELHPPRRLLLDPITDAVLQQVDDWLALVQVLVRYDPALRTFQFEGDDQELLGQLAVRLCRDVAPQARPLAQSVVDRIEALAPDSRYLILGATRWLTQTTSDDRWWVPHDIAAPPSTEPVARGRADFTHADVERVLSDL